jgi:hypothetical protein
MTRISMARPRELEFAEPVAEDSDLPRRVRISMVLIALGLTGVFTTGALLNPYESGENGDRIPRTQETHRQLGLPPCNFYVMSGLPCPSCGFTTSFSLLMHADPINALRANSVGVLLAVFALLCIPWNLLSAWRGRYWIIRSPERALIMFLFVFVTLMLTRWGILLGLSGRL